MRYVKAIRDAYENGDLQVAADLDDAAAPMILAVQATSTDARTGMADLLRAMREAGGSGPLLPCFAELVSRFLGNGAWT